MVSLLVSVSPCEKLLSLEGALDLAELATLPAEVALA
jgi:hypothetical protein